MKDDVISRQAAIDALKDMYRAAEKWEEEASDDVIKARAESCMASLTEMKLRIEKLPSAQPEIIRCTDCKWWDFAPDNTMLPDWHRCRWYGRMHTRYEDFCSRAERSESDE